MYVDNINYNHTASCMCMIDTLSVCGLNYSPVCRCVYIYVEDRYPLMWTPRLHFVDDNINYDNRYSGSP